MPRNSDESKWRDQMLARRPYIAAGCAQQGDRYRRPIPTHRGHLWRWLATIGLMLFATLALIWHDDIAAAVRAAGAAL